MDEQKSLKSKLEDIPQSKADQVVKRAELEAKIDGMASQLADLLTDLKKTKKDQTDFNIRWTDIWTPLNIIAGTPREMKQWLLKAERLIEKIQTAKAVSTHKEKLSEACDQLRASISNQMIEPVFAWTYWHNYQQTFKYCFLRTINGCWNWQPAVMKAIKFFSTGFLNELRRLMCFFYTGGLYNHQGHTKPFFKFLDPGRGRCMFMGGVKYSKNNIMVGINIAG